MDVPGRARRFSKFPAFAGEERSIDGFQFGRRQSIESGFGATRDERGRSCGPDSTGIADRDERLYGIGVSEGGAHGAGTEDYRFPPARAEVQGEHLYRRVDRSGTGRRARSEERRVGEE